jgi:DNA-directed RNA polymerase specialized sigma24 family protein
MADATVTLFEEAVKQNMRRLLAVARGIVGTRASPEDVVQQAVMNLFKHRDRYDWREPGGLLRRAVVNEALRLLRQPKMSMVADDQPA